MTIKSTHKITALLVTMLATGNAFAGVFIGADAANPNLVLHPSNYTGAGGTVTVRVCISPSSSETTTLETPVRNVIYTMNQQQATTGNLVFGGSNDIPSNAVDAESALLHEVGHCTGLGHVNLATESGLPTAQRDYTKTTVGNNGSYDLNAGADNILGSQDDLRGDDLNLHWFRVSDNNPFLVGSVIDSTTYSRNIAMLPSGSFVANAARAVSVQYGVPNTEAAMQQGQFFDEAQRTLAADDVATFGYGRSGVDEIAGTGDDYTTTLVYRGITNSGCDITVSVDANTGFASCSVGFAFVGGSDHYRVTTGTVRLNNATNWYYNQTSNSGPPNVAPSLAPIADQSVVEEQSLNIALSAADSDAGDSLAFSADALPSFCVLTDNGDRTASIDCSPSTNAMGTYTVTVTVADDGTPVLSDDDSFDIEVTPDGADAFVQCNAPFTAIPDNQPAGLVDDMVVVTAGKVVADLDLYLLATHTYPGDLDFTLEHVESGTSITAIDRPGVPATAFGCENANIETTLDDEGSGGAVEDACLATSPAISGALTPNEALSAFDGKLIAGTWRLTVVDNEADDTGSLDAWCLDGLMVDQPDTDSDGDGIFDASDNCINVANPAQIDADGDSYGNLCDTDLNNNCVTNTTDLGLFRAAFFGSDPVADFNSDGVVNVSDLGIMKQQFFAAPGPSGLTNLCD